MTKLAVCAWPLAGYFSFRVLRLFGFAGLGPEYERFDTSCCFSHSIQRFAPGGGCCLISAGTCKSGDIMGISFSFSFRDARLLLLVMLIADVLLFVAHAYGDEIEIFDLDGEATVAAWFSSVQLFSIGILFLFARSWPKSNDIIMPGFLWLVGLVFVFLSLDEAAALHERFGGRLRRVESSDRHGLWIPVYLSVLAILCLVGVRTILSFLKVYSCQALIISAGVAIFLIGAVGVEVIANLDYRGRESARTYKVLVAIEELCEMIGTSIMLYGTILCAVSDRREARGLGSASS